jgi:predicted MFS family arabinose efflux permease
MQAQQIARGWLAIELTGTNAGLGGVFLAFGGVMLLFSPVAGVAADRLPKRTVMATCQATILVASLIVAVADGAGLLEYWMLLVASGIHGAGMAVLGPTLMALTGELVERDALPNAVVLMQIGMQSTRVLGPAIAGALIGIAWIGAGGVYNLTSAIYVVGLVVLLMLPNLPPRPRAAGTSPGGEFVAGLRYVRSRRPVMLLLVCSTIVVVIGFSYIPFLPSVATQIFDVGSSGYGTMAAVGAVAAVAAAFWIAGRVAHTNIWRLQTVCGVGWGIGLLLLAVSPTYGIALIALAFLGAVTAGYQATNSTLVLTETDLEYHGRVQALMMSGWAAAGVVALPLGIIADAVGLRETIAGMGVVCLATMGWYMLARHRSLAIEETMPR